MKISIWIWNMGKGKQYDTAQPIRLTNTGSEKDPILQRQPEITDTVLGGNKMSAKQEPPNGCNEH